MKKILYFFVVAIAVSACNASSDNGNKMPEISTALLENYKPDTNKPISLIPDSVLPPQPTIGSNAGAKLNPAHGQPGHDCSIAVGAPLNKTATASRPVTGNPISTQVNPTPITLPGANNTNASSGKLNPAHGQPGHRCDIAVGQPLNSPAKTNTTLPASNTTPVNNPLPAQPAATQPSSPFPGTGTTAKLNPAHGQPGHDCSIAVGQPLKQ